MSKQLQALRKDFIGKVEKLEEAKEILKKEFIGINNTIDEVVDNVRSWYTMSSIQDKPAVINLWGLTGVGKTSMVTRLMEIINFNDKTFRLDLGEKEGNMSFRNSLSDLCENQDDAPIVIMLDEFQHARTLEGPFRTEISNDKNRMVWELIDSGKVSYIDWKRGLWGFEELLKKLKSLLKAGVKVRNGIVTERIDLYRNEIDCGNEENQVIYFYPKEDYDTILELSNGAMKLNLKKDVEKELLQLNGEQSILFLQKVLRIAQRPSSKSFTKALVIILGNIDEAYTMSSNLSSDIPADEFYEQSLKITIPDIKSALRKRFRDEQIARLGNMHIIYPALSTKAYYGIIDLELEKLNSKMKAQFGIEMIFDQHVRDILFKEGVYPTQGARPIFTTIHQIIKSRISIYLNRILKNNLKTDQLRVYIEEESQLACGFYENEVLKFTYSDTLHLSLESLRKPKKDEMQAIAAVHESGHAILSSVLMGNIPELVLSVSSDADAEGFVYSKNQKNFVSQKEIIPRLSVQLGGIIAEELIFGKENITSGASSDLASATQLIMRLLKQNGMGENLIHYATSTADESHFYHETNNVEEEALIYIQQAKKLALDTLQKEKKLLLVLSNHLAEYPKLKKAELENLIKQNAVSQIPELSNSRFYRDKLKSQLETSVVLNDITISNPIQMNKKSE